MPTSIKMSDNVYWDGDSIAIKDRGDSKYRTLSTVFRDMEWGTTGNVTLSATRGATTVNVTFAHEFKNPPIVVVGHNCSTLTNKIGRTSLEVSNVTTTGFKIIVHAGIKTKGGTWYGVNDATGWKFSWFAIADTDLTKTISTGTGLQLSDSVSWDHDAIALTTNSTMKSPTVLGNKEYPLILALNIGGGSKGFQTNKDAGTWSGGLRQQEPPNLGSWAASTTRGSLKFTFAQFGVTQKFRAAPTIIAQGGVAGDSAAGAIADSRAGLGLTVYDITTTGFTVGFSNDAIGRRVGINAWFLVVGWEEK